MFEEEKLYWVALSAVSGIGGKTLERLVQQFGAPSEVFDASEEDLLAVPRITEQMVTEIRRIEANLDNLRADLSALSEEGVSVLTREEEGFPRNLRWASDRPALLYARGEVTAEEEFSIAIVGSRNATEAGVELARDLAGELASRGITVISGLALGIDAAAHQGALDAEGRTVGVLGSGIRVVYPSENLELAERMIRSGAVLSELSPNARPSGPNLMARDRIISGLSLGVVVVEAGERSGSLDTGARAKRQNRAVWAVDWCDEEDSHAGNRQLLRGGALAIPSNESVDLSSLEEVLRETESRLLQEASDCELKEGPLQLDLGL
ncbi:MAG: DNA-protecting protein DprA [Armatimonadetes bacterium]|nr:DNA-protecting protein DprA [Armatimonadota bacterium]